MIFAATAVAVSAPAVPSAVTKISAHGSCVGPAKISRAFQGAVPRLRAAQIPVLLPTRFGYVSLNDASLFVRTTASAHHYVVRLDYVADCNGANVCSAGSFGGADTTYVRAHPDEANDYLRGPRKPADADERDAIRSGQEILDRSTRLASGLTGYYSEFNSGAGGGGNSTLRWWQSDVAYSILTRISTQANLQEIANSAIRNGPIACAATRQ